MRGRRQLALAPWHADAAVARAAGAFDRRAEPARQLAGQAARIAGAAEAMAGRFGQGGKLVVFGDGAASTDAQHIAVEFVHPVIVGKRALPAISLTCDVATVTGVAAREGLARVFSYQLERLAEPQDIALGVSRERDCPGVLAGLRTARELGLLTVALAAGDVSGEQVTLAADDVSGEQSALTVGGVSGAADYVLRTGTADPLVGKEMQVSTYHLLWELVHVFLEQPGGQQCRDDVCITCSDTAVEVTVLELTGDGLAIVATSSGPEEVSVALVSASVGDTVLVHAGEAIAVIGR